MLDLSRILAGPFATMQLADLGADVIKVEVPVRGDETRHWGPPFTDDGTATYFLATNRQRLAHAADVMIDNFLPGRLARFGLEPDELRKRNPGLITANISGFGRDNAYSGRPGFDFLAQAMGGIMAVTGPVGGPETRVGVAISDLASGLFVNHGVLAALVERASTGVGRHVEVCLLDAQVALLVNLASAWLNGGIATGTYGNAHPNIAPYETFATADHPIALAVGTDRQFRRLAEAIGFPSLADAESFATNRARVANRAELRATIESALSLKTRDTWLGLLNEAEVPAGPVNSLPEVFADAVVRARMVAEVGGVVQLRSPIRIDGASLPITAAPPGLGQHTGEILAGLGLSDDDIARLHDQGAC